MVVCVCVVEVFLYNTNVFALVCLLYLSSEVTDLKSIVKSKLLAEKHSLNLLFRSVSVYHGSDSVV